MLPQKTEKDEHIEPSGFVMVKQLRMDEIDGNLNLVKSKMPHKGEDIEQVKASVVEDSGDFLDGITTNNIQHNEGDFVDNEIPCPEDLDMWRKLREFEEREVELKEEIFELENQVETLKLEKLKRDREIERLEALLRKSAKENNRLFMNENAAEETILEMRVELENWKTKAQDIDAKLETTRRLHQEETICYENQINEVNEEIQKEKDIGLQKSKRLQEMELELREYKQRLSSVGIHNLSSVKESGFSDCSKDEDLLALSHELNELYREHLHCQEKINIAEKELDVKAKELEETQGQNESKNIALQNFKEKYAELGDIVMATKQENMHLRNRLAQKYKENETLRRKCLLHETEAKWLKDALNIVSENRKRTVRNKDIKLNQESSFG
ncbi:filament-like plant protein 1 [Nematostella vectensis]|uniref:filament-like plant protein 1 n=1 Tax=Nematostella vectensis TaxID=45351 RepID=UPI0020772D97|nr:filament-like plant protein 1 [Nematostella vectensis]